MSALDLAARALALRAAKDVGSVLLHGAAANGQTDDRAVLNSCLAKGGCVHFPAADYKISDRLSIPPNTHVTMAPGARLLPGAPQIAMLEVQGAAPSAWVPLSANLAKGAKAWSHTSNAYTVGQWVEFRSNALGTSGPNVALSSKIACVRKIVAKSGSGPYTYTLNKPVLDAFNTADSAEVGVPTMVENVVLENVTLNRENYDTHISYGIYLQYCAHVRIVNPTIIGSKAKGGTDVVSPDGIKINYGCFDVTVENPVLKHIGWYGITLAGEQIKVIGGHAEDCRHAVSVVYTPYGEPTDVLVQGMTAMNTTLSGFDTHDTGRDVVFDGCVSVGAGDDGFQFRTHNVRAINCTARHSALDGFSDADAASGSVLVGCIADGNARIGFNYLGAAELTNCHGFKHTNASGSAIQLQGGGTVRGGRFTGNAVVMRIYDARVLVAGIHAPADATQTTFGTAVTGSGGKYNRLILRDSYVPGYGNNLFLRQLAARPAGDLPPITSGNLLTDGSVGAAWSGEATLVAGTATVSTTAVKRVVGVNWVEDQVSRVDLRRKTPGGTVGALSVESVTNGTSFVIRSSNAADTSVVRWTVEL